ncbi:hypothetical protein NEMIN01_2509, partial [Nematocida minor]|uniref:uncharacterized protein n=1 Tax=Nematocida minor TaxID=1912983 RepID=UPI00221F2996
MILGRTLKQVVVGAAALGCLQRASCELFKSDAKEIKSYWTDRISYFNKEINLRSGLFKKVGALDATEEAVNSEHSSEENTKIKEAMDVVVAEDFETFTNKSLEIINLADSIISTYDDYLNNKAFSFDEAQ